MNPKDISEMQQRPDPMVIAGTIGATIRQTRKSLGLTQVQLAQLANLSDKTVRDLEHGTATPSLKAALETLDVLGLRLEVTP